VVNVKQRKRFITKYEARWGAWPGWEDENIALEWYKLIDKLKRDEIDQLFEIVASTQEGSWKPRLQEFERGYRELLIDQGRMTGEPPACGCIYCNDTGWLWCLAVWENGTPTVTTDPERGKLVRTALPCICPRGRLREKGTRIKSEVLQAGREQRRGEIERLASEWEKGKAPQWFSEFNAQRGGRQRETVSPEVVCKALIWRSEKLREEDDGWSVDT